MARRKREFLTPELTPLIDVVFLLLIFFLVSSVFRKQENVLDLQLPTTKTGESSKEQKKDTTIEITNESFAINGEVVNRVQLEKKLLNMRKETQINIKADQKTQYKNFIYVLEVLNKQKKSSISIITEDKI